MLQVGDKVTINWAGNDLPAVIVSPAANKSLSGDPQYRVRFEYKGVRMEETLPIGAVASKSLATKSVIDEDHMYQALVDFAKQLLSRYGRNEAIRYMQALQVKNELTDPRSPSTIDEMEWGVYFRTQFIYDIGQYSKSQRYDVETEAKRVIKLVADQVEHGTIGVEDKAYTAPKVGDHVKITDGDFKGKQGKIVGVRPGGAEGVETYKVKIDGVAGDEWLHEADLTVLTFSNFDKAFVATGTDGDEEIKAITCDDSEYKASTGRRPYGVKTWRFQAGEHTKAWHGGWRSARLAAKKWAKTIGASTIKLLVDAKKDLAQEREFMKLETRLLHNLPAGAHLVSTSPGHYSVIGKPALTVQQVVQALGGVGELERLGYVLRPALGGGAPEIVREITKAFGDRQGLKPGTKIQFRILSDDPIQTGVVKRLTYRGAEVLPDGSPSSSEVHWVTVQPDQVVKVISGGAFSSFGKPKT